MTKDLVVNFCHILYVAGRFSNINKLMILIVYVCFSRFELEFERFTALNEWEVEMRQTQQLLEK